MCVLIELNREILKVDKKKVSAHIMQIRSKLWDFLFGRNSYVVKKR